MTASLVASAAAEQEVLGPIPVSGSVIGVFPSGISQLSSWSLDVYPVDGNRLAPIT